MEMSKFSVLTRLRRAVKKVSFLLNFSINRWLVASAIGRTSLKNRHLSFNDRPGLRACTDDYDVDSEDSGSSRELQRTLSLPYEDDIDKRAEMFIANFHRQLVIERQISLELQYCRGNSFKSISP
ncbi:hypothetical protein FH972_016621 [Carpinus fangiana]|uniref:DUF761 domain-containing protein n=1 Tax=Carpinus fangiana TaxID=176857 RepID=A0A5N6RGY2_9ROSI|nr:hypothetical protein FH972_016621 [Carpinus fangiana]